MFIEGVQGYCGVIKRSGNLLQNLVKGRFVLIKKYGKELYVGGLGSVSRLTFDPYWDLSQYPNIYSNQIGRKNTEEILKEAGEYYSPEQLVKYAQTLECNTIVFAFNDQLASLKYILNIASLINVRLITNGYFSKETLQIIDEKIPELDIFLYSTFDKFYSKHCKLRLTIVKENIKRMAGKKIRILCPLIENENDSDSSIRNIAKFLLPIGENIPLRFIKFIPDYRVVDKPITSDSRLKDAVNIAKEYGMKDVEILIDNLV